ncbi:MAG: DNA replication and repair protein RecF [Candidatus Doudnabacteria bacterium]|nr:DNA replication and repair protein RecF [Candidatus Doudnabacteria bacterium]
MQLESLELENFRNYKELNVSLDSRLVLVLGENASGKTNFIESVYFLSRLKSFRVSDDLLVKLQEDYFKIVGRGGTHEFETVVQTSPSFKRVFKIDQQKVKRASWQTFQAVLFVPTDLNMFVLGPATRRKYLNDTLVQLDKSYAADLASLDHVLKQRSSLLDRIYKNQADTEELGFWDQELAGLAIRISRQRRGFLDFLNKKFDKQYQDLTGFKSKFEIVYKGLGEHAEQEQFLEKLKQIREAETRSGTNLLGPHRDDFIINKDEELNVYNSSRGELREQVLTIKLLQAQYLTDEKDKPVMLLDDVFSELDEQRRAMLLENLLDYQVFITSTEERHLPKLQKQTQILKVKDNQIL